MDKELKIIPPEGYEVDETNSTFACIKFKPIKPQLPKTWEEFCEQNPRKYGEAYLCEYSRIGTIENTVGNPRAAITDRNFLPSKKYAEAMLASCQLIQLRDCYNDGWEPDWSSNETKYCIIMFNNKINIAGNVYTQCVLTFKTKELRTEFLNNFKDLIEIAKPLL